MIKDRKAKKRKLEKSGLRHVAGWVDKEDKPKVDKLIAKQIERVEAIKINVDNKTKGENDE